MLDSRVEEYGAALQAFGSLSLPSQLLYVRKNIQHRTAFVQDGEDGGCYVVGCLVVSNLLNAFTIFDDGIPVFFTRRTTLENQSERLEIVSSLRSAVRVVFRNPKVRSPVLVRPSPRRARLNTTQIPLDSLLPRSLVR